MSAGQKFTQEFPPNPGVQDYSTRLNLYLERQFRRIQTEFSNVSASALGTTISATTRFAHAFATDGDGTEASPWRTIGSNPIQAALDTLPDTGGIIEAVEGHYDLGSEKAGITIPLTVDRFDPRAYAIRGQGQDQTFFNYKGSGNGIQYWQNNNGTPGRSIQSNSNALRGFTIRQTGTPRTGNGAWLNYARNWIIDDVCFGTPLSNRLTGDQGFEYGLRFDERTPGYQDVCDFNTVRNCRFSGNIHAFFTAQQADNLRVQNCYFEANPNVSAAQDGLEIKNTNGISIIGCGFLLFNSTTGFAVKLSGDMTGATINACYMEGNTRGIYLNSTEDQDGIHITGNIITGLSVSNGIGILAGINTSPHKIRGLVIAGNTLDGIGIGDTGIYISDNVQGYFLLGNHYNNMGGTNKVTNIGSSGIALEESTAGLSYSPWLTLTEADNTLGLMQLINSKPGGTSSPGIYFSADPTIASPNIQLRGGLSGSETRLTIVNNNGVVVGTFAQDGALSLAAGLATAGDSALGNASTDTTTNIGRLVLRTIAVDPTATATAGTIGEIVYSSLTALYYGKHTTTGTDTNWTLLVGIFGSGTPGTLPLWDGTGTALIDSALSQASSILTFAGPRVEAINSGGARLRAQADGSNYGEIFAPNGGGVFELRASGSGARWEVFGNTASEVLAINGKAVTRGNQAVEGDLKVTVTGKGIYIAEGSNATSGITTLVAGTATVNTTKVTANSRIYLTRQTTAGTLGASIDVTARTAGTSFTITSNGSILDTSTVAWLIVEPN